MIIVTQKKPEPDKRILRKRLFFRYVDIPSFSHSRSWMRQDLTPSLSYRSATSPVFRICSERLLSIVICLQ